MEPISYTIYITAPQQRVWDAFIDDEDVRAVWWSCVLEGTPTAGSDYAYVGPGQDGERTVHVTGEFIEVNEPQKLSMTERPGPSYNTEGEERSSRMNFSFEQVSDQLTRLTVVNDNWSDGHPGYEETKGTWPLLFSSLKSYLETGKPLPMG
ncbi:SRPBCC domain-containing protein [Saxibacter everestensis]|uniref:SRPBCC domain-containing protein n=1 Tax=Saxibacter everestensis TaxID=2909229 RepID=A0ABY8QUY8_9MICO|nr:SRPBCC domain-containing protein [Brevibacteriaceae bacterium ZFBP1038]